MRVVARRLTTCPMLARVGWNVLSPEYLAIIAWEPGVNVDVLNAALRLATSDVPRRVNPSKNWTAPAGVPPVTTKDAVKVTLWPGREGLVLLVSVRERETATGWPKVWVRLSWDV